MSSIAYLALMLDGPLQSWGFASRFQRRTTGRFPTKSGVAGMICAALGLAKGSVDENTFLEQFAGVAMTAVAIPRRPNGGKQLAIQRLEDYHTVLGSRRASGKPNEDAVITRRQYLLDARFGVILAGDRGLLDRAAAALQDPVWGIWLGRKSCIPALPVCRGLFGTLIEAERALVGEVSMNAFARVVEVTAFEDGNDSYTDQPVCFGTAESSAEGRAYSPRRVNLIEAAT